jgi:hypothetical protein
LPILNKEEGAKAPTSAPKSDKTLDIASKACYNEVVEPFNSKRGKQMGVKLKIKYSAFRPKGKPSWFIMDENDRQGMTYLNQNGALDSDWNKEGNFDHLWFKTREAARKVLRVYQAKQPPQPRLKIFFAKWRRENPPWYVANITDKSNETYLHYNGVIQNGCVVGNNESGWFKTRESARKAVRLYRNLNN